MDIPHNVVNHRAVALGSWILELWTDGRRLDPSGRLSLFLRMRGTCGVTEGGPPRLVVKSALRRDGGLVVLRRHQDAPELARVVREGSVVWEASLWNIFGSFHRDYRKARPFAEGKYSLDVELVLAEEKAAVRDIPFIVSVEEE